MHNSPEMLAGRITRYSELLGEPLEGVSHYERRSFIHSSLLSSIAHRFLVSCFYGVRDGDKGQYLPF